MACLILSLTASLVMWSLYEMPSSFRKHLISVACNFFRMSAVNVQVSQAYNSTEITRERISLIFELREICLSLQMVFSLASAAVVCAILDSTSGLEPWSVTTVPRHLKLSTSSNFSPLTADWPIYLLIQRLSDFWLTNWTTTVDSLTALLIVWLNVTDQHVVTHWLAYWFKGCLIDWLTDWLTIYMTHWLPFWFKACLT